MSTYMIISIVFASVAFLIILYYAFKDNPSSGKKGKKDQPNWSSVKRFMRKKRKERSKTRGRSYKK